MQEASPEEKKMRLEWLFSVVLEEDSEKRDQDDVF